MPHRACAQKINYLAPVLACALLLAVTGGAASPLDAAAPVADSAAGRELLQSPSDCARAIPNCIACRFTWRSASTRTVCTLCARGYRVAPTGRACWCAPGFYLNGTQCERCGAGGWCAGAVSAAEAAVRVPCGANMQTTTDVAQGERECTTLPGFGLVGGAGVVCPVGTYNSGFNLRPCTRCQGALTTANIGATSSAECQAPPGSYFLRGKAVPCAQGTYKAGLGNRDCDKCPEGWTTEPRSVAATSALACTFVLPGYGAAANVLIEHGNATATLCAANTFRSGTALYGGAEMACQPCPTGMRTYASAIGSTSSDACLVPPGWGWNSATQIAAPCPVGQYSEGWSRSLCRLCDSNGGTITTAGNSSISPDQCFTPAGHGSLRWGMGITGYVCPANTFGRSIPSYGLMLESYCDKCMENMNTLNLTGSTSLNACVTNPGHGYEDGVVSRCEPGYWAVGGDRSPCTFCGEGYSTTENSTTPSSTVVSGAVSPQQCAVAAGWTFADTSDASKGLTPCVRGFYKSVLGNASCTQCPQGTTTTIINTATSVADCNACRPGFGANVTVSPVSPACTICASGTYNPGFQTGGANCTACPKPANFTGRMTSRRGISGAEECVPEFPSDGGISNLQEWDIIPMNASYLTDAPSATDAAACQDMCAADTKCQYFEFYNYTVGSPPTQCRLRLAANAIERLEFDPTNATDTVLFEVKETQYAVYAAADAADAATIGVTISTLPWDQAKPTCDRTAACVGLAVAQAINQWRLFGGSDWAGANGKVRIVGDTINSWIPEPLP